MRRSSDQSFGGLMANRLVRLVVLASLALTTLAAAQADSGTPIPRATSYHFASRVLGESRVIDVALPAGYERDSTQRYPVLVVLDGEFEHEIAASIARFYATMSQLPPLIVVGIRNTDRNHDFTPAPVAGFDAPPEAQRPGGAAAFLSFISDEVVPWIDRSYRTAPLRVLVGHSLGGLFALYTIAQRPDLFTGYLIMEPSAWWKRRRMARRSSASRHPGDAPSTGDARQHRTDGCRYDGVGREPSDGASPLDLWRDARQHGGGRHDPRLEDDVRRFPPDRLAPRDAADRDARSLRFARRPCRLRAADSRRCVLESGAHVARFASLRRRRPRSRPLGARPRRLGRIAQLPRTAHARARLPRPDELHPARIPDTPAQRARSRAVHRPLGQCRAGRHALCHGQRCRRHDRSARSPAIPQWRLVRGRRPRGSSDGGRHARVGAAVLPRTRRTRRVEGQDPTRWDTDRGARATGVGAAGTGTGVRS